MNKVITFGCRLNFYESEIILENLEKAQRDNVVVVHSCAVTNEAERQVQQKIRRLYKNNPNIKIIVAGCAVQLNPKTYMSMPGVIKVLGNEEKLKYENYLISDYNNSIQVNSIEKVNKITPKFINKIANKSRAFIEIQNGCNHSCTFCVITKARGNNRSSSISDIINQVQLFVDNSYNEVVFTGVDITDFGSDVYNKPSLGLLIKEVLKSVPMLKRLRLSSIDIAEINNELLDVIINEERLMPHFHLSLQSGNNLILKRMKRRHNREQVIEFCNVVRKYRPKTAFGADIIAGFPTETDDMFNDTVNLIKQLNIPYLHIFPYSEKEGTPASRMPQVPTAIRKQRAKYLREISDNILTKFYNTLINTKQRIIVEKRNTGRAENFALVKFEDNFINEKTVADVLITGQEKNYLTAKLI